MSPQAGWLLVHEIVPRLRAAVPAQVKPIGAEDAEELIQDATALAAKLLHNVEQQGKPVTPGNIAYYTLQHLKSGRRSTGSSCVDVHQAGTQLNGRTEVVSLDDELPVEGDDCLTLHDALAAEAEDPSVMAGRNLDWAQFCRPLSPTRAAVVRGMAEGRSLREVGAERGVGGSTLQHHRRRLAVTLKAFMGEDILTEIVKHPGWKNNLVAQRERVARRRR